MNDLDLDLPRLSETLRPKLIFSWACLGLDGSRLVPAGRVSEMDGHAVHNTFGRKGAKQECAFVYSGVRPAEGSYYAPPRADCFMAWVYDRLDDDERLREMIPKRKEHRFYNEVSAASRSVREPLRGLTLIASTPRMKSGLLEFLFPRPLQSSPLTWPPTLLFCCRLLLDPMSCWTS